MTETINVLLVEDVETDAKLVLRTLHGRWPALRSRRVEDEASMRDALAGEPWDVILCDWSLPHFGALDALRVLRELGLDLPFVIVSGTIGEEPAVQAMREGASDYLLKDKLGRLVAVVEREVREGKVRRELREHQRQHERFFGLSLDMLCIIGFDGYFKRVNPAWERTLGWSSDELLSRPVFDVIHPEDVAATREAGDRLMQGSGVVEFENRYRHNAGGYRRLLWSAAPFAAENVMYCAARDITERREAEDALRASETQYRALFDKSPFPKWVYDVATLRFLAVNDAAIRHYGYSRDEFLAMGLADVRDAGHVERLRHELTRAPEDVHEGLIRHRKKDGTSFDAHITSHPISLVGRSARLVVAQDVTEVRRLEDQLRQSQKMEAIGSLAGGVAHDFNNLLSVILSYTSLILDELPAGDALRADLEEVHEAGVRATHLTRQLLAFSRRQVLDPRVVDLGEVINDMQALVRRLVPEDIEVVVSPSPYAPRALIDPNQLEQVVMNLAVNARDAMPKGGRLTIETSEIDVDADLAREHPGLALGPQVALIVTDTGTGIDAATCAHIFEPFFTTKDKDRGTGLGLSTVLGIVQQSGGHVWVDSKPGHGAKFTVCFPRAPATVASTKIHSSTPPETRGTETILLVEDDEQVRTLASRVLRKHGYGILEAENGGEALLLCEQHEGAIDLLFTDVVMKHMSGAQLAERLARIRPDLRVLFMSGYTDDLLAPHGVLEPGVAFVQKPLTPEVVLRRVREVLDSDAADITAGKKSLVLASKGTVLVVDDDDTVRALVRRILATTGLTVVDVASSEAALALDDQTVASLGLVLTDVVMPHIDGHALAERLRERRPTLPVLFMSGYGLNVVARYGVNATDEFLPKPFTARRLRERVLQSMARSPA